MEIQAHSMRNIHTFTFIVNCIAFAVSPELIFYIKNSIGVMKHNI